MAPKHFQSAFRSNPLSWPDQAQGAREASSGKGHGDLRGRGAAAVGRGEWPDSKSNPWDFLGETWNLFDLFMVFLFLIRWNMFLINWVKCLGFPRGNMNHFFFVWSIFGYSEASHDAVVWMWSRERKTYPQVFSGQGKGLKFTAAWKYPDTHKGDGTSMLDTHTVYAACLDLSHKRGIPSWTSHLGGEGFPWETIWSSGTTSCNIQVIQVPKIRKNMSKDDTQGKKSSFNAFGRVRNCCGVTSMTKYALKICIAVALLHGKIYVLRGRPSAPNSAFLPDSWVGKSYGFQLINTSMDIYIYTCIYIYMYIPWCIDILIRW